MSASHPPVPVADDPYGDWPVSNERLRIRAKQNVVLGLAGLSAAASFGLWISMLADAENASINGAAYHPTTVHWIVASVTAVAALVLIIAWYLRREAALLRFRERVDEAHRESLRERQEVVRARGDDIGGLLAANRALLDLYQSPVRRQAQTTSYVYSVAAIVAGLLTLIVGLIVVAAADTSGTRLTAAALSAFGTALAGYIARTFLRVYEKAQEQLNYYFREPLVTSYLLTAERLAEKLEGTARQDAYSLMVSEIARSVHTDISPATPAQE